MRYGKLVEGNLQYAEIKHGALVVDGKLVFTADYNAYGYYLVKNVFEDGTDKLVDGIIKHYQPPYKSTPRNEKQNRIYELKALLSESDYKAIKFAEGELSAEEYEPTRIQRRVWREEINTIEAELA